jgi:hypothetical protein
MKIAPIIDVMKTAQAQGSPLRCCPTHTGCDMTSSFFGQPGIPDPDENFEFR